MGRLYAKLGVLVIVSASGSACTLELVDTLMGPAPELASGGTGTSLEGGPDEGDGEDGEDGEDAGEGGGAEANPIPTPLFDVGHNGEVQIDSCEFAAEFPSHLGCEFFGIDVDGPGLFDFEPFGFVVINPLSEPVTVDLERYNEGRWAMVEQVVVAGEDEYVFLPGDTQVLGTGIQAGAVFRISSERPVVAIQAHPAAGSAISASATMLQPSTAWTSSTPVAGWRTHISVGERAFLGVVARDRATATVHPNFSIAGPPPSWIDAWIDTDNDGIDELVLEVGPGELLRIDAVAIDSAEVDHGTSGSTVESGQDRLTGVFSAHTCAAIPDFDGTCGHLQEQLSPMLVGTHFVAPRLLASDHPSGPGGALGPLTHERTMFQVVATEPVTKVVFSHHAGGGVGVEDEMVVIDPDEPYALIATDHDLAVVADKPIILTAYMTNAESTVLGSPSMVQIAPVDQWTQHHWVWVPEGFETHLLVSGAPSADVGVLAISGLAGAEPPAPAEELVAELVTTTEVAGQSWAVHRIAVQPGIHRIDTEGPSSVVVAGWRELDGFAYLGGWGPSFADLGPEG